VEGFNSAVKGLIIPTCSVPYVVPLQQKLRDVHITADLHKLSVTLWLSISRL